MSILALLKTHPGASDLGIEKAVFSSGVFLTRSEELPKVVFRLVQKKDVISRRGNGRTMELQFSAVICGMTSGRVFYAWSVSPK